MVKPPCYAKYNIAKALAVFWDFNGLQASKLIDVSSNYLPRQLQLRRVPPRVARALGRSSAVASRQVVRAFMVSDGPE